MYNELLTRDVKNLEYLVNHRELSKANKNNNYGALSLLLNIKLF